MLGTDGIEPDFFFPHSHWEIPLILIVFPRIQTSLLTVQG